MISILVPLNDSVSSRAVIDYLIGLPLCPDDIRMTLVHVFRKPTSGEELMGKKFMSEQPSRLRAVLQKARDRLVAEKGFAPEQIDVELLSEPFASVTEGIMSFYRQGEYDMVIIGRKNMSKSEEFVLGDVSVKLVRSLEHTSVLVVKS